MITALAVLSACGLPVRHPTRSVSERTASPAVSAAVSAAATERVDLCALVPADAQARAVLDRTGPPLEFRNNEITDISCRITSRAPKPGSGNGDLALDLTRYGSGSMLPLFPGYCRGMTDLGGLGSQACVKVAPPGPAHDVLEVTVLAQLGGNVLRVDHGTYPVNGQPDSDQCRELAITVNRAVLSQLK